VVRDLTLIEPTITGRAEVGALAGRAADASIERVHVRGGTVTSALASGAADTGGLVGYVTTAAVTIEDCSSSARVVARGRNVGGLIGDLRGTLRRCWASGDVGPPEGQATADAAYGGLVGLFGDSPVVEDCFAQGAVHADATGSRTGVGGLVGDALGTGASIARSLAVGPVTAGSGPVVGGLVGTKGTTTTATAAYWDEQTSGVSTSALGTPRTTSALKTGDLVTTFEGWDFESVWRRSADLNGGYPSLRSNPSD
jgi:hypothetical protein